MSRSARGTYYDGKSSTQRRVTLALSGERLLVTGEGVERSDILGVLAVSPRLGTVRRSVRFPDGALCELSDDQFLDELLRRQGRGRIAAGLHRWERSIPRALAALALTVALVWCFVTFAIPALARRVAFAVPAATERSLGRESLGMLDRVVFSPTKLPAARRQELAALFSRMTRDLPWAGGYRLEFRSSPQLGANALALPSGIIVVTDRLVEIAGSDDELAAVLAHEMGHVRHRHALRHLLQNSATGLVMAALTGDITSVTSLSAGLPTALVDAKFSRDFETEADDAAVAYLKSRGIPLRRFADILSRLQAEHDRREGNGGGGEKGSLSDYFSTHPVTRERIARFMGGAR
ncbi:M48 family metallopeptidase [Geobacter sp.]|uniref:M48 family metallopeptidase n=1 Tax=Geobacter sp. TaxID=46610 RepID=UPI0026114C7A|nr:M48 family metallopeptidase [Geobacter sp.]